MAINPKFYSTDSPKDASAMASVKNLATNATQLMVPVLVLRTLAKAADIPEWYLNSLLNALPPSEKANILNIAAQHPNNPFVALQALAGASPSLTAPVTNQIKRVVQAPAEALDVANQMVSGLPMTSPDVPSTAPGIQTRFTPEQLIAKKAAMHAGAKAKLPPPYFASAFPPNWDELPDEEKIRWYQANPGKAPLEGATPNAIREMQDAGIKNLIREKHGSIKAYDSSTGRSWDNSMSPTGEVQQTNTGDFNTVTGHVTTPSGIPMQSPSQFYSTPQVAPGGMGAGRAAAYTPQRGTTASPVTPSDPSQASEYVQAQLARQQGRATEIQLELLQGKNAVGLEQLRSTNPYGASVIQAIGQGKYPPQPHTQPETEASKQAARLSTVQGARQTAWDKARQRVMTELQVAGVDPSNIPPERMGAVQARLEALTKQNMQEMEPEIAVGTGSHIKSPDALAGLFTNQDLPPVP